jgi:hypothetical protein
MTVFRTRLHIRDKATHRTWIANWPIERGVILYAMTGSKCLVTERGGYSEYNDRGEPVLDSWIEPLYYLRYGDRPYIDHRRLFKELEKGVDGPCTLALLGARDSPNT